MNYIKRSKQRSFLIFINRNAHRRVNPTELMPLITGKQVFIDYASPADTLALIKEWLAKLKSISKQLLTVDESVKAYSQLHLSFVHIHPFWDGNRRLASL